MGTRQARYLGSVLSSPPETPNDNSGRSLDTPGDDVDRHPLRWRMLALLATAELLGMALWFVGSAAAPLLADNWALTPSDTAWLTNAVQLGFVAGTAAIALFNLADTVSARALFAVAAIAGAVANLPLAFTNSYSLALFSRAATGVCLAGVYPPAMKMAATWFRKRRGVAVGTIVGALTVGKAMPYLAQAVPHTTVAHIALIASLSATVAAVLVFLAYRDGPYAFPARHFRWRLVSDVFRVPRFRLALGGYLGHMAELYSYWTWIASFFAASEAARLARAAHDATSASTMAANAVPRTTGMPPWFIGALSFAVIAVGAAGCIWGGVRADVIGRERLVIRAMTVSGSCALLIGALFGHSWWLLAPLALVWGFFVIADSAQFSVMVTESVPGDAVGTALMLQTSLGFLLTTSTIQLVPIVADHRGWQWAFAPLMLGPLFGVLSIRAVKRVTP